MSYIGDIQFFNSFHLMKLFILSFKIKGTPTIVIIPSDKLSFIFITIISFRNVKIKNILKRFVYTQNTIQCIPYKYNHAKNVIVKII